MSVDYNSIVFIVAVTMLLAADTDYVEADLAAVVTAENNRIYFSGKLLLDRTEAEPMVKVHLYVDGDEEGVTLEIPRNGKPALVRKNAREKTYFPMEILGKRNIQEILAFIKEEEGSRGEGMKIIEGDVKAGLKTWSITNKDKPYLDFRQSTDKREKGIVKEAHLLLNENIRLELKLKNVKAGKSKEGMLSWF